MRDIRFMLKANYTRSRALVIGINQYQNASPLSYAVSDAEEVRSVLIDELGFLQEDVAYLVDAEATKTNILRAFMRFAADDVALDDKIFYSLLGTAIPVLAYGEKLATSCPTMRTWAISRLSFAGTS